MAQSVNNFQNKVALTLPLYSGGSLEGKIKQAEEALRVADLDVNGAAAGQIERGEQLFVRLGVPENLASKPGYNQELRRPFKVGRKQIRCRYGGQTGRVDQSGRLGESAGQPRCRRKTTIAMPWRR